MFTWLLPILKVVHIILLSLRESLQVDQDVIISIHGCLKLGIGIIPTYGSLKILHQTLILWLNVIQVLRQDGSQVIKWDTL